MARSRASANYEITATDRTRAGIQSARNSVQSLDNLASKLGVSFSLLSAAGVAAPGAIISAQAPLIDQMGKLSTQTGATVEFIQAYRREAALAGIASTTFDKAIEKMAQNTADAASGIGEARVAFDALGISAQDLAQQSPEDQFLTISEALEGVSTEGQKAALAADIFGRQGTALIRVQADAIRETKNEMIALNIALSAADVKGVEAMNDAMFLLQDNTQQAAKIFTAQLAPAITGVINQIFGASDSMAGFRDTSLDTADVFVNVVGAIGNGMEGIDNVFESVKIGIASMNVQANKVQNFFERSDESARRLAVSAQELQDLQDNLAGQTGDATFWVQLEAQVESARKVARIAAEESEDQRKKFAAGIDIGLADGESNIKTSGSGPNDSAFQSLLDGLASGTDKIEREYAKRLGIIDDFRQSFPDRADEALQAEIAALEARDKAIEDYHKQQSDTKDQERSTTLAPLESNVEAVKAALATETEAIVEEYQKRSELLQELGVLEVDRQAEIDELLISLAQQTGERLASIEKDTVSKRIQTQSQYAAKALGVAASLVDSIGAQGEKSKRVAARISQAEALVAGISAAERARNHAALTGGVISGGVAAAISWGSTLANVAGIEAALNGSAPGGVSTSSGVSSGATSDIQSGLESGGGDAAAINVTFVFDDAVIDKDAVKKVAIQGVAEATQNRELTYNDSRNYYQTNDEGAIG